MHSTDETTDTLDPFKTLSILIPSYMRPLSHKRIARTIRRPAAITTARRKHLYIAPVRSAGRKPTTQTS